MSVELQLSPTPPLSSLTNLNLTGDQDHVIQVKTLLCSFVKIVTSASLSAHTLAYLDSRADLKNYFLMIIAGVQTERDSIYKTSGAAFTGAVITFQH